MRSGAVMALLAMMAGLAVGRPVLAQIVIGDDHPQVMVDQSVLDRLGPEASLPDLLLGRQAPAAAPGYNRQAGLALPAAPALPRPVALHKPAHKPDVKHIHKAKQAPAVTPAAAPAAAKLAAAVPVVEARNDTAKPMVEKPAAEKPVEEKPAEPAPQVAAAPPKVDLPPAPAQPPAKAEPTPAPPPKAELPPPPKAEAPPPPPPPPAKVEAPPPPAPSPVVVAPPAAPPPPVIAAASPQETRLPPPPAAPGGDAAPFILFEKDQARLPDDARASLTRLAGRMAAEPTVEVQLLAYAEGDENSASKARRLSLSRALAVRSFLIDQGVRSTRIEVRALGNKVSDGPSDRVDLVIQKH
ncbi:MAG TPA: OmpA family protein [Rhodospirillaceae bacterium]|nr:OmpA family protein [Rhodospirillaceae bacterium]